MSSSTKVPQQQRDSFFRTSHCLGLVLALWSGHHGGLSSSSEQPVHDRVRRENDWMCLFRSLSLSSRARAHGRGEGIMSLLQNYFPPHLFAAWPECSGPPPLSLSHACEDTDAAPLLPPFARGPRGRDELLLLLLPGKVPLLQHEDGPSVWC